MWNQATRKGERDGRLQAGEEVDETDSLKAVVDMEGRPELHPLEHASILAAELS
jgi:hypothetical protein